MTAVLPWRSIPDGSWSDWGLEEWRHTAYNPVGQVPDQVGEKITYVEIDLKHLYMP